jgi:3-isopropylmalate/(R)-2-methylmalate dehydratase small subunit
MSTGASRVERVTGTALVLPGHDVDTDRIIPARYLKSITFEGLEAHVFGDDRLEAERNGVVHPFDDGSRIGAGVLLVGGNFGCGSSREHAPRAIAQRGIKAIVGESFGEIFFSNSMTLGLPCLAASPSDLDRLRAASADPAAEFTVDLHTLVVSVGDVRVPVTMPDSARAALLSGDWDATTMLIDAAEDVERTRARLPYLNSFTP